MFQLFLLILMPGLIVAASNEKKQLDQMPNMLIELTLSRDLFSDKLEEINKHQRETLSKAAQTFITTHQREPTGLAPLHIEMQDCSLKDLFNQSKQEARDLFALIASLHITQRAYLNMKLAKTYNSLDDRLATCKKFEQLFYQELIALQAGLTDGWFPKNREERCPKIYFEKNKNVEINDNVKTIIKAGTTLNYLMYAMIERVDPEVFALFEE